MSSVTIEDDQAELPRLIASLAPGDERIITREARPVAQLVGLGGETVVPIAGRCRGMLTILAEDDAHLEGWVDSLP